MNVLKRARVKQKIGPKELSEISQINRTYYWRIETGQKRASLDCAERISMALKGAVTPLQIMKIGPAKVRGTNQSAVQA